MKFKGLAVLWMCLLPMGLAAQQAAPSGEQPPVIKATAEEVVLDVIVRDKKGNPIKDLKLEEFTVSDDGKQMPVKGFRLVEGREAIENGAKVPLDPLKQVRLVTLVFERLGPDGRRLAKQAAEDLIKDQAQNVFYSVVAIDTQLAVLQQFTRDRAALKAAIQKATNGQYMQYAAESARIKEDLKRATLRSDAVQTQAVTMPTTDTNPTSAPQQIGPPNLEAKMARILLDMTAWEQSISRDESTRATIFSLLSLVRGQAQMPGRKTMMYFSEGMWVPTNLDEPFRSIMSTANRGNVSFYVLDCRGVMTWSQNQSAAEDMASAARDSAKDITSEGSATTREQMKGSDRVENAMRNNVQLPLRALADDTGGFLIADTNDLRKPLRQVSEEINAYYEITYNPGIESYDGSYRKTSVNVARKDMVVHTRNGYFALPPSASGLSVLPYELPLLKALTAAPLPKDVEFRSTGVRFQSTPTGSWCGVIIEVPMSGVTFTEVKADNTFKSRVSVLALVKDERGEIVQKFSHDLPRKGAMNLLPQAKAGNFIYKEQFELPPGRYTLETAVVDHEVNKTAAKKIAFVVPPKVKGVTMSSMNLVRNYQKPAQGLDPNDPFQYDGGRITPSLGGIVYSVKGATLSAFFTVYADTSISEKPTMTIEFLAGGASLQKADLPIPAPDAQGKIPYVLSIPAEGLPPGDYEIKAVAKQGSTQAEEHMFVTVAAPKTN